MKIFPSKLMRLALLAVSVSFVACDDDLETSNLILDQTQEATVTAYLYAELDKTELGLEYAPNGTKVFVSVDNSEFNPDAKGAWIDTVYVQGGKIESIVPVTSKGVTVRITPAEFEATQKQAYNEVSAELKKIFSLRGGQTISSVKPGENRIDELTYFYEDFDNLTEMVTRRFTIRAVTNADDGIKETAVISVTFYNGNWSATASSDEDGYLVISLPKEEETTAEFTYNKKIDADNRKIHRYKAPVPAYTESSDVRNILTFSDELFE